MLGRAISTVNQRFFLPVVQRFFLPVVQRFFLPVVQRFRLMAMQRFFRTLLQRFGRRAVIWGGILTVLALLLDFVPLFDLLGYDFSFAVGLCAALAAADIGHGVVAALDSDVARVGTRTSRHWTAGGLGVGAD